MFQRPFRPPALAAWLLAAALLLAQALGLAHRVQHGGAPAKSAAAAQARSGLGLKALFGHQAGDASCPLYDHAVGGEAGLWPPVVLPVLHAGIAPLPALSHGRTLACVRAFDARAPPRA